jgi:putative heme-binding domain-containing protein
MHWQAAGTNLRGDLAAGEMFFFGKEKCTTCHIVSSKGSPIGPDLSDLGNGMTVEEVQSALQEPSAHITPGYGMVTVTLRDGKTVRGFARNWNNFVALDERTGKPLWHFPAGSVNKTSPMTYMVGGKQFVAIAIGPNIL